MLGYRVVRSFFSSKTSENTRKHLSSKKTHDIPAARFLLQSSVICALTVRNTMFVPECLKVDARGPTKMVVWFRFHVQNCGDNIWIYRSTILIFSFHLFTSDWSNHVKPCFPPSEIEHQHVIFLWAAISDIRVWLLMCATWCKFYRTTKSQGFLPLQNIVWQRFNRGST